MLALGTTTALITGLAIAWKFPRARAALGIYFVAVCTISFAIAVRAG